MRVQNLGIGDLFGGGDQRQCLRRGGFVVEHHCSFHGVIDRACDQMQVVIGIHPQGQNTQQRQRHTGHGHTHQRNGQMTATDDRAQGRASPPFEQVHVAAGLRLDNCRTLG
ncbi:hypothetical protein D3C85_1398340 [compost metagenome]